ncbi:hypothetical protein UPYG_G00189170 [Umbra pygmaea]|uniref:XRCC4 n=1 Tax=Umbra pygmaea TaxID=75934 RepID=A0ABD0XB08_UMBPY
MERGGEVLGGLHSEGMSGSVRQINVASEPSTPYFLRVDWTEDLGKGFTLVLSDGSSSWYGEVSEEDVTSGANRLGVKRESYVEDLHQAMTSGGREEGPENVYLFQLSLDHGCLSYERKTITADLVRVGAVDLHPAPDPVELSRQIMGQALGQLTDLEAENRFLLEENKSLRLEHQRLLAEMTHHVEEVEKMQKDMFSRFVMVLNKKKDKIKDLQDTISNVQKQTDQGVKVHHRVKGARVEPEAGNMMMEQDEEEQSQSFHPSQEPTVLIRGVSSQPSSIEDLFRPEVKSQVCYFLAWFPFGS